jgi:MYXO-CTERM domain-containing protein
MKIRTLHRKPASIAKGRWAAYATAGAASAFTCANSAEATIHYSGRIGEYFPPLRTKNARFQLDQPGDSFRLKHYVSAFTSSGFDYFGILGRAGNAFAGFYCPNDSQIASVSKLNRGDLISARPFLPRNNGLLARNDFCSGQFESGHFGFIAFKFNSGSGDQYGWVRLKMGIHNQDFWLVDYAYADLGEPIRAGQISSNEMVPEEGSLGWLALGAAGLLVWRKRRRQAAS